MKYKFDEDVAFGAFLGFVFVVGSAVLIGIGIAIGWLLFGGGA